MTGRAALVVVCLGLGGCAGLGAPASGSSTTRPSASDPKLVQAQRTHEYPGGPVARERVLGGDASAVGAIRRFATAYINWDALSVAADMRALALESIGQARAAMELAAANTAQDYELRRGGISNRGTVEAIAPLAGQPRRFVVVTLERTSATATDAYQGLAPGTSLSPP